MLVYIPGDLSITRNLDTLARLGLDALHDDGLPLEWADVLAGGPDGGQGVVCGWNDGGHLTAYQPQRQTWHRVVSDGDLPAGRAWIGWHNDHPPTPENLLRKQSHPGELLALEDGREWLIPIAQQLPHVIGLDDSGGVKRTPKQRYRGFYESSFAMLERLDALRAGQGRIESDEGFAYAVSVLQVNYRITRDVVAALGLLADSHLVLMAVIVCEYRKLCEALAQKKTADDSHSSTVGSAA